MKLLFYLLLFLLLRQPHIAGAEAPCTEDEIHAAQICVANLNFPTDEKAELVCGYLEQGMLCVPGVCCADAEGKLYRAVHEIVRMGEKAGCENLTCRKNTGHSLTGSAAGLFFLFAIWMAVL